MSVVWSHDAENRLKALFAEGMSDNEVAKALGRTHRAVQARASMLGIHRGGVDRSGDFWTDARVAVLRECVTAGLSHLKIAEAVGDGCTRNQAMGKAMRLGIAKDKAPAKPPKPQPRVRPSRAGKPRPPKAVKPATIKPPTFPKPSTEPEPIHRVAMADLQPHMCRWPIGTPGEATFGFCGHQKEAGLPYCVAHAVRCYVRKPDPSRKAKDARRQELYRATRRYA